MKVDYDPNKNRTNIETRGLSFDEVLNFEFETALLWEDTRHDYKEQRWCGLGYIDSRLHSLVFTVRGEVVWVISFRKANKREQKRYDQKIS